MPSAGATLFNQAQLVRARAQRAWRLAGQIVTEETSAALERYAEELERQADEIEMIAAMLSGPAASADTLAERIKTSAAEARSWRLRLRRDLPEGEAG